MLLIVTFVLVVLWALGVATGYTLGGFINVLIVLAIASALIRIIQGRQRPV